MSTTKYLSEIDYVVCVLKQFTVAYRYLCVSQCTTKCQKNTHWLKYRNLHEHIIVNNTVSSVSVWLWSVVSVASRPFHSARFVRCHTFDPVRFAFKIKLHVITSLNKIHI